MRTMHPHPALRAIIARRRRPSLGDLHWPRSWWTDDLEWGFGWTDMGGDGTPTVDRNAAAARNGSYGLRMITGSTPPGPGYTAEAIQEFTAPAQDYQILTAALRAPTPANGAAWDLSLGIHAGGHLYRAALRYNVAGAKFQYVNSAGVATDVSGGSYAWPTNTWVPLSLQLRASTQRYGTVSWPGGSADLSAQGLYDLGEEALSTANVDLRIEAAGATPLAIHADDFEVTHSPNA